MVEAVAQDQLRAFVERIERLAEEKQAIADDIKLVYGEAKGNGFDTKVLREVIRLRKMDRSERLEREALLELYMSALGMIEASPEDALQEAVENLANLGGEDGGSVTLQVGDAEPVTLRPRKGRRAKPAHDPVGFELGEGA